MLSDDEWFGMILQSYLRPPVNYGGLALPNFPSDELQINTTGRAGEDTLREAFIFYQDCLQTFADLGNPLREDHCILDFGAGWGRVTRFFLRELSRRNIFGIDVSAEFVDICKRNFRSNNFIVTTPFPPTPIPSSRFDYIVGYSVFSHLSEIACSRWMQEFHRILVPNGLLVLTTRGRPFLDMCESLKELSVSGYPKALSMIFEDFGDARERYDKGEFLHSNIDGVSGGGPMNSSFYGETLIPEGYAKTAYSKEFLLEKFLFDSSRQSHPIMFFRRKESDMD